MVIYEVNLTIQSMVFDDYVKWLTPHVHQMLGFKGFKKARYLAEDPAAGDDLTKLTVLYEVDSMENLQHYLDKHAQAMRDDGLKRFPGQVSATRRIFTATQEFTH